MISSEFDDTKKRIVLNSPFHKKNAISYGLMVYSKNTKRWAIVQRKHSIEFLLYIRGHYRVSYLPFLLSRITKQEYKVINECINGHPEELKRVYTKKLSLYPEGLEYALVRMKETGSVALKVLSQINVANNLLPWNWPKGRQNYMEGFENPFLCAIREFKEEMEIDLPRPIYISNSYVSEVIKHIYGRSIESRFWIYVIEDEIDILFPKNHPEVSDRKWATTDECKELTSRGDLFTHVQDIVTKINTV